MTQFYNTSTTPITTGVKTWTCGFQPVGAHITVVHPITGIKISEGWVDSTGWTDYNYALDDGTIRDSGNGGGANGQVVSVHGNVGGVSTEVNAASFNSTSAFTATGFKMNVTNVTGSYQYKVRLWG